MDSFEILSQVCDRFGLGKVVGQPTALHGGVNRVWRLQTTVATFGVHQLLGIPQEVDAIERCQGIFEVEVAASRAGVRLPTPVPDQATGNAAAELDTASGVFTVHEWVEAEPVTAASISPLFARSLGDSVGRLHYLQLEPATLSGDILDRRPSKLDWLEVAARAERAGLTWASSIADAAGALAEGSRLVDTWEAASRSHRVTSHRDLTSANTLIDHDIAVLIDWESAGPVTCGAELGRTALDHFLVGDQMDEALLGQFLSGYAQLRQLPPVEPDWCALWVRGLIVFAEHCARSCIAATSPRPLLDFQSRVVEVTPYELTRRIASVEHFLAQFNAAAP